MFTAPSTATNVMFFLQLSVKLARSKSYLGGDAAFKSAADAHHRGLFCGERKRRVEFAFHVCAPRARVRRTDTKAIAQIHTLGYVPSERERERERAVVSRLSHFV